MSCCRYTNYIDVMYDEDDKFEYWMTHCTYCGDVRRKWKVRK